jgi:hypothetical protein
MASGVFPGGGGTPGSPTGIYTSIALNLNEV